MRKIILAALSAAIVAVMATIPATTSASPPSSVEDAINAVRVEHGVPPLRLHGQRQRVLRRVARSQARRQLRRGKLDHETRVGTTPHERMRRRLGRLRSSGETLVFFSPSGQTPAEVVAAWMASPPHRAVLLDPSLTRLGVGAAEGKMGGVPGVAYCADFATLPRDEPLPIPPPEPDAEPEPVVPPVVTPDPVPVPVPVPDTPPVPVPPVEVPPLPLP